MPPKFKIHVWIVRKETDNCEHDEKGELGCVWKLQEIKCLVIICCMNSC